MQETMRIRVAPYRVDDGVRDRASTFAGPYLADKRLVVDRRLFFNTVSEVLWAADPGGISYPIDEGRRYSEAYVRRADVAPEVATPADYDPVTEIWAIRERDGAALVWGFMDPARGDLEVAAIMRATAAGYNDHDYSDVIIGTQAGRGGDSGVTDWVNFLGNLNINLISNVIWVAIAAALAKVGIVLRSKKEDAEISRIAKQWEARGINSPFRLRRWIDKRTEWSAVEVTTRLGITVKGTLSLLTALGYEPLKEDPDTFVRSGRKTARKHRERWMKQETESNLFDVW